MSFAWTLQQIIAEKSAVNQLLHLYHKLIAEEKKKKEIFKIKSQWCIKAINQYEDQRSEASYKVLN